MQHRQHDGHAATSTTGSDPQAPEDHAHHGHEHHHHDGHGGHEGHVAVYRRLFWIMLVLAVPVVAPSPVFAEILGYDLPDAAWLGWVAPVLGTVMYVWGGKPFYTGAIDELRSRKPGMMLLVGTAITVAFGSSLLARLGVLPSELNFWW